MNIATKYGNYCALIGISLVLVLHFSGVSAFWTKGVSSILSSLIEVIFIFLAIHATREKEFSGYIDFKNAAKAGMTMLLVNAILYSFFIYLYYQFIDTSFMSNFLSDYEKYSKLMGKSEEEIKKLSDLLSAGFTPISAAWGSFSQTLFVETFIALIAARILRRNPPQQETMGED
ncbi:MAG: DUF4199 domain-containing protein [Bacteroidetes bacterium]|nr:DUF4199 domain-containing protein [Bacteroidota bacterium]